MPENTTSNRRRLDPRNPLVVDIRDLSRRPGSTRVVERRVPTPAAIGVEMARVPDGATLLLDFRLESVTEGVLVTGTVTAPLEGVCGRCLEPVSADITVDVCELFAYPDSATDATTDPDEITRIEGDLIDLEPVVHDVLVLEMPVTPLCRPDCAGLCPDCGQRLDDVGPGHEHEQIDPRWAALAERRTDDDS